MDKLKKTRPPGRPEPGKPSWQAKSGGGAAALLATLVTLGGTALLFASASGELDQLSAAAKAAPPATRG